jgi:enoyl-[acyl-carrier protein] reductase III
MHTDKKKNLTALVTGGSRGIGRAVAVKLAATCAKTVVVNYLENDAEAEIVLKRIAKQNASCVLAKANLLYPAEINDLFETVKSVTDRLDIFVHCAALGTFKPLKSIKPNQWDLTMNINARAFLLCAQRAAPMMKSGKMVAVSSLGSRRVVPNYGAMGPTKAALESIVRYLAVELAQDGIQVNGVSGGFIETDSIKKFPGSDALLDEVRRRTPAQRLGTPDEIAEIVAFLASPAARWINGQIVVADGGMSLF